MTHYALIAVHPGEFGSTIMCITEDKILTLSKAYTLKNVLSIECRVQVWENGVHVGNLNLDEELRKPTVS